LGKGQLAATIIRLADIDAETWATIVVVVAIAIIRPGAIIGVGIAIPVSIVAIAVEPVVPVPIIVGVVPRMSVAVPVAVPMVCQRRCRSERHAAQESERKRGVANGIGHLEPH
jgi:hypothetical protein